MYLKDGFKLFIAIFLTYNNFVLAATEISVDQKFTPNFLPEVTVHKVSQPINIDGELDDLGWKTASIARNFSEFYPGDQTEPVVNTRVLLTYDSKNIYFAFICFDEPAKVRASYIDRD
ncbi:MAG: hypothetical protein JSW33_00915, partial [bacterium]